MEGYILQEYGSAIVNENVREMSLAFGQRTLGSSKEVTNNVLKWFEPEEEVVI